MSTKVFGFSVCIENLSSEEEMQFFRTLLDLKILPE